MKILLDNQQNSIKDTEIAFIKKFIKKDRQQRWLHYVESNNRQKLISNLAHCNDFKNTKGIKSLHESSSDYDKLYKLIEEENKGRLVYIISENSDIDQSFLPLDEALEKTKTGSFCAILIINIERLALYLGEFKEDALLYPS